ncbi:DUF4259 domain-containing protein [Kitasatospora sp. NPDC001540]|uniref:DUF4259 domain-containing protein n=1 Tax=Kitasatospora sp. NPDC001540 TaxID=3364014 RepID=UPI0036CAE132
MGTWSTGPFDNDTAADFAGDLDEAAPEQRAALLRTALTRALHAPDGLDGSDGARAVAAAALVAAQCPGGEPVTTVYGPDHPLPPLLALRPLAARAVRRVLGPDSDLTEGWFRYADFLARRDGLERLHAVLREPGPRLPGQETPS